MPDKMPDMMANRMVDRRPTLEGNGKPKSKLPTPTARQGRARPTSEATLNDSFKNSPIDNR